MGIKYSYPIEQGFTQEVAEDIRKQVASTPKGSTATFNIPAEDFHGTSAETAQYRALKVCSSDDTVEMGVMPERDGLVTIMVRKL